jgi:curli biogenesis system outer membrane secretion channel CsgG
MDKRLFPYLVILLFALTCWLGLPGYSAAQNTTTPADTAKENKPTVTNYTGPKKRVGVMDMEVKVATTVVEPTPAGGVVATASVSIPPPTDFGTGLTEMLTTALVNSGRFVVLERKALADIQAELALAAGGTLDPNAKPDAGRLLGAQALIRGAVTEYTYKKSSTGGSASFLQGIGVGASKAEASVVLDIRLYDVTTGQILDSVKAEGRAKSSGKNIDIDKPDLKMSASSFSQTPLGHATRQAIDQAVEMIIKRMEQLPWEGRIAEIEPGEGSDPPTLYINAGARMGIKENDVFEIVRPGKTITDPETRVVIGRTKDKRLGTCLVQSVTPELSLACPTEGTDFQVGDIVHFADSSKKIPAPVTPPK